MHLQELAPYTSLAADFALLLAVPGLFITYRGTQSSRAAQREAAAVGLWKEHLQLALRYPDLASGRPQDMERYEGFVSLLLFTCEQILALEPGEGWESVIREQIGRHRAYLRPGHFDVRQYSDETRALILDVVQQPQALQGDAMLPA